MIDLFGMVIFLTVVGIGLLDLQSGLSPFAAYRSAGVTGGRRPSTAGRRGADNHPTPPTPAR